ncbi:MAG: TRAP transporter small permease [Burkholderiaceae bacterium]|nr:TRAP transporter small permease [Burkholderiaceae bacterium]
MKGRDSLLRRVVVVFSRAVSLLGLFVMGLMVLHIAVDVVARFFLGRQLPATIAFVANYYMVAVTFLPLVVAERERKHIEVEVLAQRLPQRMQSVLRLATWALSVAVFSLLGWESAIEAARAYEVRMFMIEQSVRIETWISYFMLPIGFFSAAGVSLARMSIAVLRLPAGLNRAVDVAQDYFSERAGHD